MELAEIQPQSNLLPGGKLTVFVGPIDHAGPRQAMLARASARAQAGARVIASGLDTQARSGLEAQTPELQPAWTGETATGLPDLEALLLARPDVVLLGNLAAENPPGARHPRRYLDALELLAHGIDVLAEVTSWQIESLNDICSPLIGWRTTETIPDEILVGAEFELIDPAPEELTTARRERGSSAAANETNRTPAPYRPETLAALRELTQRWFAQCLDPQTHIYRNLRAGKEFGLVRERVMVCVSGSGLIARVIRAGRQMAASLHAEWVAVYVETPEYYRVSEGERERIARALHLAEELGAETVTLPGQKVAAELLRYAQAHGITKIVVGKPYRRRWREMLRSALADELVRDSGSINVFIVNTSRDRTANIWFPPEGVRREPSRYAYSLLTLAVATGCGLLLQPYLDPINIALIYLLGVVLSATTWGLWPSILSSVIAVILLDALFVPPFGLLSIEGARDLLTLSVFLVVAVIVSELGAGLRAQVQAVQQREQQTVALYALSRDLAFARERADILSAAVKQLNQMFDADAEILLPDTEGRLQFDGKSELEAADRAAAGWAFEHGEAAGNGNRTFAQTARTFLPLRTAQGTFGVLGLYPHGPGRYLTPGQRRLLETFAGQIAIALEHSKLSAQAEQARLLEASDRFRSALLSSISHDLRTPLASIMGSVTSLLDTRARLDTAARSDLLVTIKEEATRLNRLVGNLLNMTRLEAGVLTPQRDWHSLEEVIGVAVAHMDTQSHPMHLDLAPDLAFAPFDFVLIEQVLLNLLENANKFSPPGSPVELSARCDPSWLYVDIADHGIGIPATELDRVFEKFYRVPQNGGVPGTGLGLSICKGIIQAHGGTIRAEQRPGGGTRIRFTLPVKLMERTK